MSDLDKHVEEITRIMTEYIDASCICCKWFDPNLMYEFSECLVCTRLYKDQFEINTEVLEWTKKQNPSLEK